VRVLRRCARDVTIAMGTTSYNTIMNSCKVISSTDPTICNSGTIACQKTTTGTAFKAMAKRISSATVSSAPPRRHNQRAAPL
jgi:hypothetical protein